VVRLTDRHWSRQCRGGRWPHRSGRAGLLRVHGVHSREKENRDSTRDGEIGWVAIHCVRFNPQFNWMQSVAAL